MSNDRFVGRRAARPSVPSPHGPNAPGLAVTHLHDGSSPRIPVHPTHPERERAEPNPGPEGARFASPGWSPGLEPTIMNRKP